MSSSATESDLKLWVSSMMKTLNHTDYKLNISGNSTKGDGYLGEITFVEILLPNGNSFQIVVKSAKQSGELRKQTPVKDAYDREIFFYAKILPLYEEFQRLKSIAKPFKNYAKCYYASTETMKESLLLQNLKSLGYELHDRKEAMNLNHILSVIRAYGRLHALSLAMRHQRPAVFKSLTKNMSDIFAKFFQNDAMAQSCLKCFEEARDLLKRYHLKMYEKYQQLDRQQLLDFLLNLANEDHPTFVILHGDCWNNNFMFKYQDSDRTKPVDMAFLDFQLSKVASAVVDLSYFFYCCADKNSLEQFDFILQVYHSSLSDFLTELGGDPDVFPFPELHKQWKTYGRFGVIMATFLLKISLCDSNEAPDFAESCENGTVDNLLNFEIKDRDVYERRIIDVLVCYGERFFKSTELALWLIIIPAIGQWTRNKTRTIPTLLTLVKGQFVVGPLVKDEISSEPVNNQTQIARMDTFRCPPGLPALNLVQTNDNQELKGNILNSNASLTIEQQLNQYFNDPLKPLDVVIQTFNGFQIDGNVGPSHNSQGKEIVPYVSNEHVRNNPQPQICICQHQFCICETIYALMRDGFLTPMTVKQFKIFTSSLWDCEMFYLPPFPTLMRRRIPAPFLCAYAFFLNSPKCNQRQLFSCNDCAAAYCSHCLQSNYHSVLCFKQDEDYNTYFLKEYCRLIRDKFNSFVRMYQMKLISTAALVDRNSSFTAIDSQQLSHVNSMLRSRQIEMDNQSLENHRMKSSRMKRVNRYLRKMMHQVSKALRVPNTKSKELLDGLTKFMNNRKKIQKISTKIQSKTTFESTENGDLSKVFGQNPEITVQRQSYDEFKHEIARRLTKYATLKAMNCLPIQQINLSIDDFLLAKSKGVQRQIEQPKPQPQALPQLHVHPQLQRQLQSQLQLQPQLQVQPQLQLQLQQPQLQLQVHQPQLQLQVQQSQLQIQVQQPQLQIQVQQPQLQLQVQPRFQLPVQPRLQILPQPYHQFRTSPALFRERFRRRTASFPNNQYAIQSLNRNRQFNYDNRLQRWTPTVYSATYRSRNRPTITRREKKPEPALNEVLALLPRRTHFYNPHNFHPENFTRARPIPGLFHNVTVVNNSEHYPLEIFHKEGTPGELCRPWGLCVNYLNQILVTDRLHHCVKIFDSNGVFLMKFGEQGTNIGQFDRPAGITISLRGDIVVADKDNHRIQIFNRNYEFVSTFGKKGSGMGDFNYPWDVATSRTGLIGVTDSKNRRIQIFDITGNLVQQINEFARISFNHPRGICFTPTDELLVSDFNLHRVVRFCPGRIDLAVHFGGEGANRGQFNRPQGIICDDRGNIVIVDTNNHRIQVFNRHLRFKFMISNGPGSIVGKMNKPADVALDPLGRIAVIDGGNNRVQVF